MLGSPIIQGAFAALLFAESGLAQGRIADECTDLYFNSGWLVGKCLTGEDKTTRRESAVSLNRKITNRESHLEWVTTGEGWYSYSCYDCELQDNHKLVCTCKNPWGGNLRDTIDLESHIANYNGYMLSNLTSEVVIPKSPSKFPVPNDFFWQLHAGDTQWWCEEPTVCDAKPTKTPGDCTATHLWRTGTDSQDCTVFQAPVSIPMVEVFQTLTSKGPQAWEFTVYGDYECKGKPLGKIGADQVDVCTKWDQLGYAVKVTPKFNAA